VTAHARTAEAAGLTLAELAARHGLSEQTMGELLRPFVQGGIVAVRGSQLVVVDRLVRFAFEQEERPT
jgi:hypothetical protein